MSAPNFASTESSPSVASYRELIAQGLTDREAGTLAAYLEGLDVAHHRWTLREVNRLLFLRHLNRTHRIGSTR